MGNFCFLMVTASSADFGENISSGIWSPLRVRAAAVGGGGYALCVGPGADDPAQSL